MDLWGPKHSRADIILWINSIIQESCVSGWTTYTLQDYTRSIQYQVKTLYCNVKSNEAKSILYCNVKNTEAKSRFCCNVNSTEAKSRFYCNKHDIKAAVMQIIQFLCSAKLQTIQCWVQPGLVNMLGPFWQGTNFGIVTSLISLTSKREFHSCKVSSTDQEMLRKRN
jgi:hypothetical protein